MDNFRLREGGAGRRGSWRETIVVRTGRCRKRRRTRRTTKPIAHDETRRGNARANPPSRNYPPCKGK
eukprot:1480432-Prorocentrum_lima.AAC.1